jgi:hypothetical protein
VVPKFHRGKTPEEETSTSAVGEDVKGVASLSETTQYGYWIGFPAEASGAGFNSDVYDNWVTLLWRKRWMYRCGSSAMHGLPTPPRQFGERCPRIY